MNNTQSLVIGIVSGILTTALIYLAVQIFKKIVIPWYQNIVYQGVVISGEWLLTIQCSDRVVVQDVILNLSQRAHRLEGTATYILKVENLCEVSDHVKSFKIEGKILDRFVVLVLRHAERSRIGIETLLLDIVGDGRKMAGYSTAYDVGLSMIVANKCVIRRSEIGSPQIVNPSQPPITAQPNNSFNPTPR